MKRVPPFQLVPKAMNAEAENLSGFKWAGGDIGKRHKLGGEPDFIQGDEHPRCASCEKEMTFYAQLDSISDDYVIADCGMIYVFVCFDCFEVHSVIQSH